MSANCTPVPAASSWAAFVPSHTPPRPSSAAMIGAVVEVEEVADVAEGTEGAEVAEVAETAETAEAIEAEAEASVASASVASAASAATSVATSTFAATAMRPAVSGSGSSAKLPNTAPVAATRQGSKYLRAGGRVKVKVRVGDWALDTGSCLG